MDHVVILRGKNGRLSDTFVQRGTGRDMANIFLVEGKLKMGRKWNKAWQGGKERKVLKARELEKEEKVMEFQEMPTRDRR